jgi:hypothetical protein
MRSMSHRGAVLVVLAGLVLVLVSPGCRRPKGVELTAARDDLKRLHARLEAAVAKDPLVAEALAGRTDLVLAMRKALVEDLARTVAAVYLDDVVLDLRSLVVSPHGDIRKRAFFGTITAGSWRATIRMDDLRGTVKARPPTVRFGPGPVVSMIVRGVVQETTGRVTVDFAWDSKGMMNAVCRDFEITRSVTGRVPAQEHELAGRFVLSADAHSVVARPDFPDRDFRLAVEIDPESWAVVREALATQDSLFRCGLALDPDDAVAQLRGLVGRGIPVKLPDSLFRPVRLPGALQETVEIGDRPAALLVRAGRLRVARDTLWANVEMHVGKTEAVRAARRGE